MSAREFAFEDFTAIELNKFEYRFTGTEACGELQCDVLERLPRYENSGYTKQVAWVDQHDYQIRKVEFYDRRGDLLKVLELKDYRRYDNGVWRAHLLTMNNVQTNKQTDLIYGDYRFGVGLSGRRFREGAAEPPAVNDMRKVFSPKGDAGAADPWQRRWSPPAEWDFSATLELESRLFASDAAHVGQDADRGQYALAALGEIRWRNDEGSQRASIIPRFRWDATDPERNLVDFSEFYWAREGQSSELLVGANTEFWGVAESVHLVDIINQTDSASDIDGEDKLGQPMVNLVVRRDWGELGFYAMPYFRDRTFAGSRGRFRGPLLVDTDRPVYESSAGRNHIDVAFRYSHFIGAVDIGVSAFSGTSREPRLIPDSGVLRPYYDQIDQAGVDLQYTGDAWLWKFEGIVRNCYADTFFAAVGGFEYT